MKERPRDAAVLLLHGDVKVSESERQSSGHDRCQLFICHLNTLFTHISMSLSDIIWATNEMQTQDIHTPYSSVSCQTTMSDLERLSKIFNDTKHQAVSLRQLGFLTNWRLT